MRIWNRLLGRRKEVLDVSPKQMGVVLVTGAGKLAFEGRQALIRNVTAADPSQSDNLGLRVELLSFCLLPFDIISATKFAGYADEIRGHMLDSGERVMLDMVDDYARKHIRFGTINRHVKERLLAYSSLFGSQMNPDSLQRLSFRACEVALGRAGPDLLVAGLFAATFSTAMKHVPEALDHYTIVPES